MSLSKELLIELFERLPILPLTQIAANINNPHDLIKVAFRSEKWRRAIGSREIERINVNVIVNENDCEVRTKGCSYLREPSFMVRNDDNCSHKKNLIDTFHFLNLSSTFFCCLRVDNAEWMELSDLLKINCYSATFGLNRLKSGDLKVFLYCWMNGTNWQNAQHLTFQMSQKQVEEIDMSEVLDGLNAVPWNPSTRDRKFVVLDCKSTYFLPSIDLADGYDIRHSNGRHLVTIYLNPNTHILHCCFWKRVFLMDFLDYEYHVSLVLTNQTLAKNLKPADRKKCETKRRKQLQSLRNLRNDTDLEVDDLTYVERIVAFH